MTDPAAGDPAAAPAASASLEDLTRRLQLLRALDRSILSDEPPGATCRTAARGLVSGFGCSWAFVAGFSDELASALIHATWPVRGAVVAGTQIPVDPSSGLMETLRTGADAAVDDLVAVDELPALLRDLHLVDVRSLRAVPLLSGGDLLGTLIVGASEPGGLPPRALEVVEESAELLAIALRQARMRDDIERHTLTLEHRVSQRTAELRDSIRQLEAFSYSVSHDLRAPLRAMQGFGQALVEDYGDVLDAEGRDLLARIVGASERMDELIGDLLDYSRISVGEIDLSPTALEEVVEEVCGTHRDHFERVGAAVHVAAPLGVVWAHRLHLVQVVNNLFTNAAKFVKPGERPVIRVSARHLGGAVRLVVADEGIGIDVEHRERIFRIFERLHSREEYPGTGIGLAIARKAAERMGGSIGLESHPGAGSRFWIELPEAR